MNFFNKLIIFLLTFIFNVTVLVNSYADNQSLITDFNEAELALLFEQNNFELELIVLSHKEMVETQGAFGPWGAVGGAVIGGIGYTGYAIGSQDWDWGTFYYTVGTGAITGFSGGAYAWYFVPRITFGTSIIAGRILGGRHQNQINIPTK